MYVRHFVETEHSVKVSWDTFLRNSVFCMPVLLNGVFGIISDRITAINKTVLNIIICNYLCYYVEKWGHFGNFVFFNLYIVNKSKRIDYCKMQHIIRYFHLLLSSTGTPTSAHFK